MCINQQTCVEVNSMNLVMRKLALYEKYDAEQKTKLNITVTKPTDTKLIQNVQNILKKLNYSY